MGSSDITIDEQGALQLSPETLERLNLEPGQTVRILFEGENTLGLLTARGEVRDMPDGTPLFMGSLANMPIADVFSFLTMIARSGVLRIFTEGYERAIYFRTGEIIFAISTHPEYKLGVFLLNRGVIDKRQLREVERDYTSDRRFGKLLVEKGFLTTQQLWDSVRAQIEEIVYSLFTLQAGDFIFVEGENFLSEDLAGFSLSSQNLLMEGIRRTDEWALINEELPDDGAIPLLPDSPPAKLPDTENARKVLTLVDGRRSIKLVVKLSRLGEFEGKRALYDLLKSKHVKIPREDSGKKAARDYAAEARALVDRHNTLLRQLYADLKSKNIEVNLQGTLRTFLKELATTRFADIFQNVELNAAGEMDPDAVIRNQKPGASTSQKALAIEGLGELLNFELLQDALREMANYAIFTVRNSCPDDVAEHIVGRVRQLQAGKTE
ncbi:MAG: DUF4388 domain-containing protein [Deltaproteobacteria bacterium]|nr:DUF4388 domain-containing protein [Deltaproteobacteria bacterium]